jgi:hypothetical protein
MKQKDKKAILDGLDKIKKILGVKPTNPNPNPQPKCLPVLPHYNPPKPIKDRKNSY